MEEQLSLTEARLESLLRAARAAGRILILPHDNPDPDAIASATALRWLLSEMLAVEALIAFHGSIGRAENRALVRYLGHPLQHVRDPELHVPPSVALVDTQPDAGNCTLPSGSRVAVVIDRHRRRRATGTADFVDVRSELGATSTILVQYLQAAGLELAPPLATALFYGIKSNTMALSRDASLADAAAYGFLQPLIEIDALAKIEYAQVPADYFKSFDRALGSARVFNGLLFAYAGPLSYPELAAELADVLLRLERAEWVICLGHHREDMVFSVRTRHADGEAERLANALVGSEGTAGGHGTMAGGRIPLAGRDDERVAHELMERALRALGFPPDDAGESLV